MIQFRDEILVDAQGRTLAKCPQVDVYGHILAKCPQCGREYHLDEHASTPPILSEDEQAVDLAKMSDIEAKISAAISQGKRFLIAMDEGGIHFREVMCVTGRLEHGEVEYAAKPILSGEKLYDVLNDGLRRLIDCPQPFSIRQGDYNGATWQ